MQPQDQDQVVGIQTLFRCQYNTSSNNDLPHYLGWLVNNRSSIRYPDTCTCNRTITGGEVFENMTIISTLCITAAIECNETQVQCVVAIFNYNVPIFVLSEVATLYVRSKYSYTIFRGGEIGGQGGFSPPPLLTLETRGIEPPILSHAHTSTKLQQHSSVIIL